MNKSPSPIVLMLYGVACMILGAMLFDYGSRVDRSVLPSSEPGSVGAPSTGPAHKSFSSPSSEVASDKSATFLMRVSAYCPGPCCCGKWADGYTASGKPAVGLIVAAPQRFPFGTILSIPGYSKRAVVQDRGGAITGNRLDVLFAAHEEAKQWGVQELIVKEIR